MSDRIPAQDEARSARGASSPSTPATTRLETLLRECRRGLAAKSYDEVIDKLELNRPPEWQAVDESGARLLRLLGQAYLGRRDYFSARDCFEHLLAVLREKCLLSRNDCAATLTDLCKCYRELRMPELAEQCRLEAQRLLQRGE